MGWFRKRKQEVPPPPPSTKPKRGGLFSTHEDVLMATEEARAERILALMDQNFPRPLKDMKVTTTRDGQVVTMAMDEAFPDLSLLKLQNTPTGFLPLQQLEWYLQQGFIGYQTAALLMQNWLINKVCTIPAQDAIRNGYNLTINDGEDVDPKILAFIRKQDKAYKVRYHAREFLRLGRGFGVRHLLFKVRSSDPNYYEKPFNIDAVRPGTYEGMTQIDPYWISPELNFEAATNAASMHFYEPTWWYVSGRRIHRSHMVIFKNKGDLPDILKPTYFYGGIPLPQLIAERIYAAERTANEAPLLALSKRLITMKVDMTKALADLKSFMNKMGWFSMLMNNFGIKALGEDEEMDMYDTALGDMDALIMTQFQLVCAIGDCPATKVMGTSPKGFGASGDYEKSSYRETLESLQEEVSPVIDRHHELLMASEIRPKYGDFEIEHLWNNTDTPTEKEQAEIQEIKARTDNQLVQAGAIDGTDARLRIVEDPESGYNGFEEKVPGGPGDREAQQAAEKALEQPVEASNKGKAGGTGKDWLDTLPGVAQDEAREDPGDPENMFDPVRGLWNGAQLVTTQKYLDQLKVDEKMAKSDWTVHISPEFIVDGKKYRTILDGHHSLAAAVIAKVIPHFVEQLPKPETINAITRAAADNKV